MYLALTGREIDGRTPFAWALSPIVPAASFGHSPAPAMPIRSIRCSTAVEHPGQARSKVGAGIARCFGKDSVEGILAALDAERGAAQEWARGVLADLGRASPT
jgi:hypothetical protein